MVNAGCCLILAKQFVLSWIIWVFVIPIYHYQTGAVAAFMLRCLFKFASNI